MEQLDMVGVKIKYQNIKVYKRKKWHKSLISTETRTTFLQNSYHKKENIQDKP